MLRRKEGLWVETTTLRLPLTKYQWLSCLSGLHEVRYGNSLQKVVQLALVSWKLIPWQSCLIYEYKWIFTLLSMFIGGFGWNSISDIRTQCRWLFVCFVKVGLGKACFGYGLDWNHVHPVTAERATVRKRLHNVLMLYHRVHRFESCFCLASIWVDRN